MGRRLKVSAALALTLAVSALNVSGQEQRADMRVLARTKGSELTAELPNRPDWCQPDLTFTVRGQEDTYFKEGETDEQGRQGRFLLQKLLGVIRTGLDRECSQTQSITFNGFVDDVFVYRGHAVKGAAQGDWVLMELPVALVQPPDPPRQAMIAAAQMDIGPRPASLAECDAAAAHPNDPEKPKDIRGVADDDIDVGKALAACEEALRFAPDIPRLKFQLARAYLLYDKPAEGVELMTEAAEAGHGPAIAAIGDFVLYGVLYDEPDPEAAKSLYQQAALAGFKPAEKLAAAIVADPKEDKTAQATPEASYHHSERIKMLLKGEPLPGSGGTFKEHFIYASNAIAGIKHHCPDAGIDIPPATILEKYMARMGVSGFAGLLAVSSAGYEELEQQGMDDGYALAFTKGCSSGEVAAIHKSVRSTLN